MLAVWRNTCNRQATDEEADVGNRHVLVQTAHVILEVAADDDDDGTRAEEEQCLEHSVGKQVEDTSHVTQTTVVLSTAKQTPRATSM